MHRHIRSGRGVRWKRQTEDDATVVWTPRPCGSVETPVAALNESGRGIRAVAAGEVVQRRQRADRVDPEDRPVPVRPTQRRRPVEVAVASIDEAGRGISTVGAGEAVKRRQHAGCVDPEDGARLGAGDGSIPRLGHVKAGRRPVEAPVAALDEPCDGIPAVASGECVKRRQRAGGVHPEDSPAVARPETRSRPVEAAIAALDQPGHWQRTVYFVSSEGVNRRQ